MHGFLESADTLDARQFLIAIKKLADTLSYGADRSPFLGSGIEFVQSRTFDAESMSRPTVCGIVAVATGYL